MRQKWHISISEFYVSSLVLKIHSSVVDKNKRRLPHMYFRLFMIAGLLISSCAWGVDRRPAVEDFVGIEVEHPEAAPQGPESLVNLEKDIETIQAEAYTVKKVERKPTFHEESNPAPWTPLNIAAVTLILGLPLLSWLFVVNRFRKRASVESASNVEVLEKYRREREQSRKKEDAERKAS